MAEAVHKILITPGSSDVEVKKSHFLGALRAVKSEEEARAFIDEIRKKHYDARHNCFAMRIGTPSSVFEKSGDDGEPQGTAGKPMLEILKGAGLYDVCAVVTRYFGGTLLGTGGLVRAYSDSLKEALSDSETAEITRGCLVVLSCGYGLAEKLKRAASNMGVKSMGEEYAAECTLKFIVREEAAPAFTAKITEISNGQAVPEVTEGVLFADGTKPYIYE
ncbi:MAG: YigZ family protein [Eubacteriales bacterium]|nr:YigZ family protein [Eubacteriales bacterium]